VNETKLGRLGAAGLLFVLAAIGLTDAAQSRPAEPDRGSVIIPSGAVWKSHSVAQIEGEPFKLATRQFNVKKLLERLGHDDPTLTPDIQAIVLKQLVQSCIGYPLDEHGKPRPDACTLEGETLSVTANEAQLKRIPELLQHWEQFGEQQICVETRILSTAKELGDLLPTPGGQIISPAPVNHPSPMPNHAEFRSTIATPTYTRVLSADECIWLCQTLQSDSRSNIQQAPKFTLFSGTTADCSAEIQRPFVTGMEPIIGDSDFSRLPQISVFAEGVRFQLTPWLLDVSGAIQIQFQFRHTEIADVETMKFEFAEKSHGCAIQIPNIRETSIQTSCKLQSGETFLVAPLRRDKDGKLQIYLLTPRWIDLKQAP
jgi:hypothetical protein